MLPCRSCEVCEFGSSEQQALLFGTDERNGRLFEAGTIAALGFGAVQLLIGTVDPPEGRGAYPLRREGAAQAHRHGDLLARRDRHRAALHLLALPLGPRLAE